jgi:DUF218 domain
VNADAVVVLGGHGARAGVGAELVRGGAAPVLALSEGCRGPSPEAGEATLLRFAPVPFNTVGEARSVAELVREHGWNSVIVVTSGHHVRRSRLIFRRIVPADVRFVSAPYPRLLVPWALLVETVKLAYTVTLGRRSNLRHSPS